jgi:hypothetical protein
MVCRTASVTLALLVTVIAANAKDVKIGPISVVLAVPSGQCELDEGQPDDARLLSLFRKLSTLNQLLGAYADCQQLTDFRAGKQPALNDFAEQMTPIGAMNITLPASHITQVCAMLRTPEGKERLAKIAQEVVPRIEEAVDGMKVNETRFLGVVEEEPEVCYSALLQKLKTEAGTEKTQVGITATTLINGKIVIYNLYGLYAGDDTLAVLLAKHKSNVAALIAANKH